MSLLVKIAIGRDGTSALSQFRMDPAIARTVGDVLREAAASNESLADVFRALAGQIDVEISGCLRAATSEGESKP